MHNKKEKSDERINEIVRRVISGKTRLRTGPEVFKSRNEVACAFRTIAASFEQQGRRVEEVDKSLQARQRKARMEGNGLSDSVRNSTSDKEIQGTRERTEDAIESLAKANGC